MTRMKLLAAALAVGVVILAYLWSSSAESRGSTTPLASPSTSSAASIALASSSASDRADLAKSTHEPVPVADVAAVESAPAAAPAISSSTAELETALATFASDAPNVVALRRAVEALACAAEIDPAKVLTDKSGIVQGRFTIPGTKLAGSFTIEGDRFDVQLMTKPPPGADAALSRAIVSVSTSVDEGRATQGEVGAKFYPDTSGPPDDGSTAERHMGWGAYVTEKGTTQHAQAAQWDPTLRSWRVASSSKLASVDVPGDWDVRANQAWVDRLAQFQPKK